MGHACRRRNKRESVASQDLIIHTKQQWQMKHYCNNTEITFTGTHIISTGRICSALKNTGGCRARDTMQNTWAWKKLVLQDLHSAPKALPACVGFEVLVTVVRISIFWDITRCSRVCLLSALGWFLSWFILRPWRLRRYVLRNVSSPSLLIVRVYCYVSSLPSSDSNTTVWLPVIGKSGVRIAVQAPAVVSQVLFSWFRQFMRLTLRDSHALFGNTVSWLRSLSSE
jgi:hypothetical protein